MRNKNKFFSLFLLVIFGTVILLWGITSLKPSLQKELTIINNKKVTVYQRIIKNNTDKFSYLSYKIEEEKTALDLLQKSSSVTIKGSGENAFVTAINGVEASEKKKTYWSFYINDKLAEVGAGSYKLVNGDKIQWKLENY